MKRRGHQALEAHFLYLHNNPPAPFNPAYDPKANDRFKRVSKSLEDDGWYANHTREECKAEWHRRYEALKKEEAL